jgi:ribosomal-protein-alanine N-acetyltransferase
MIHHMNDRIHNPLVVASSPSGPTKNKIIIENPPLSSLTTERLLLNSPLSTPTNELSGLWQNPQVRRYLGGPIAEKDVKLKLSALTNHWNQHGFGQWIVRIKKSEKIIDVCGLHYSEDGLELSYMFFPEYWGQGLAFEATQASLSHGFNSLNVAEVVAITQEANHASCKLLEKLRMQFVKNITRFNATQRIYKLSSKTRENQTTGERRL